MFTVDYLVVHPISGYECDMSVSYSRIWKKTWQGLDVGHRGLGTSFKLEVAELVSVNFVSSELYLSEYGYCMKRIAINHYGWFIIIDPLRVLSTWILHIFIYLMLRFTIYSGLCTVISK
jgi:hypothetical protein